MFFQSHIYSYRNERFICPLDISIRIQQNIYYEFTKLEYEKIIKINFIKIMLYDKTGLIYRDFCKKINQHFKCGCVPR